MVTAIWSNDPEFYETILGGDDLLNHIFIKVNYTDINQIVSRFELSAISENTFTRSDEHKYACVIAEDTKTALSKIKKIIETV